MKILIYNGPGTEKTDVLFQSLKENVTKITDEEYSIHFISWNELQSSDWMRHTKLLIIPGGRDLPYVEHFSDEAISNIKTFVENGGSYFGICAGAYFACSHVEFAKDTSLEVVGDRKLDLFKGIARGPTFPGFEYNSTSGARMVQLKSKNQLLPWCYYNGGGEFIPADDFFAFQILMTYDDYPGKIAVASRDISSGKAVISFVHPEMNVKYLEKDEYTEQQWTLMIEHEKSQNELMRQILRLLLL